MTDSATRPLEWDPPRQAISRVPYLPGLDGMRALAVMAVMVYHANPDWLPGGFLGVEVFFVISGYLITLLLIGEHERSGTVSLRGFYTRRARRLLPALCTLLVAITIYTALFKRDSLGQLRGDVIAALAYVSNWYQIWVGQGYTASGDFAPLRHLWSLAVEEQFYLVWPLIMVCLIRLGRRRLPDMARWLFLAAFLITVAVALLYYSGPIETCASTPDAYWQVAGRCLSKTDTLYLSTPTRATGLLLGSAFAMVWRPVAVMRGPIRTKGRLLDIGAVFGLAALGALCLVLHIVTEDGADPWLFRGGFFVIGIASLFVIAAVTHRGARAGALLGNPVLLWIGTRSYGLYLYHWPIYQIMRGVAGRNLSVVQFVSALILSGIVTELSYRFIESPIRRGQVGRWWRRLQSSRDPAPRRVSSPGPVPRSSRSRCSRWPTSPRPSSSRTRSPTRSTRAPARCPTSRTSSAPRARRSVTRRRGRPSRPPGRPWRRPAPPRRRPAARRSPSSWRHRRRPRRPRRRRAPFRRRCRRTRSSRSGTR